MRLLLSALGMALVAIVEGEFLFLCKHGFAWLRLGGMPLRNVALLPCQQKCNERAHCVYFCLGIKQLQRNSRIQESLLAQIPEGKYNPILGWCLARVPATKAA